MSFYYRFGVTGKRVFRVLEGWVRFFGGSRVGLEHSN
jgi:hypothetical protein